MRMVLPIIVFVGVQMIIQCLFKHSKSYTKKCDNNV